MEQSILTKQVTIKLRGKEVIARFPNIGQSLKIEQMKQLLTDGRYAIMAFSGLKSTNRMLDLVDAVCYLSNVVEDFYGVLGIKGHFDIMNMDMGDGIPKELLEQYQKVYEPFYNAREERIDRPIKSAKNVVEIAPEKPSEEDAPVEEASAQSKEEVVNGDIPPPPSQEEPASVDKHGQGSLM